MTVAVAEPAEFEAEAAAIGINRFDCFILHSALRVVHSNYRLGARLMPPSGNSLALPDRGTPRRAFPTALFVVTDGAGHLTFDAPFQIRIEEALKVAIEDIMEVVLQVAGAAVFNTLRGMQKIIPNL